MRPALEHWLNHNISVAEAIVARIILAARAREASRAAQAEVSRKSATSSRLNLPGKLSDCTNPTQRRQRAVHRRRRFGRRLGEAGARSRAPGDSAAARQGAEHRERVAGEGAREQGAVGPGHRARLRARARTSSSSKLRYGKVIILADADSDGNHIATLLLTFIYRHLPQLIANGKVFLAQPPLYRIDIGKETLLGARRRAEGRDPEAARQERHRATPEITRFKGLGEMMPKVLWETTLNPRTRRLLRVEITDQIVTDRVINELMGKDASARFRFIMERAEEAEELDV